MKWTTTTVLFWVIRNRSKFVNIIIIIVVAVFGWLDRVCWSSSHAVPWLEVHRLLRFPVWWPKTDLKTKKRQNPTQVAEAYLDFFQRVHTGWRGGAGFGLSSQIIIVFLQPAYWSWSCCAVQNAMKQPSVRFWLGKVKPEQRAVRPCGFGSMRQRRDRATCVCFFGCMDECCTMMMMIEVWFFL